MIDVLSALQNAGLKGKALEKGQMILADAEAGKAPDEKTFSGAEKIVSKLETDLNKKPEYQKASAQEKAAFVQEELQSTSKESMSNKELVARLLIGFVPQALGAAIGAASGMGAAAGGVAGGEAATAGLKQLDELKKRQEEREDKIAKSDLEKLKLIQEKSKAASEERRKEQELLLRGREVAAKEREAGKKGAEVAAGSKLTAEQTALISGIDTSEQQLAKIEKIIDESSPIMGPIAGRLASLSPYATETKGFDAQMKLAAQKIGVSLERGKLTDADIDRYRAMLPNISDTPDVAKQKIAIVKQLLADEKTAQIETLAKSGYNVSKFMTPPEPSAAPAAQAPAKGGSSLFGPKEAVAGEKPKRIIQNGHEYIYNPATGTYE